MTRHLEFGCDMWSGYLKRIPEVLPIFGRPPEQFNLRVWFLSASLIVTIFYYIASGSWLGAYLTKTILAHEAEISQQLFQSLLGSESIELLRSSPEEVQKNARLVERLGRLSQMEGILRTNIYSKNFTIIWSSDLDLIGKNFIDNEDLAKALKGFSNSELQNIDLHKSEHEGLGREQTVVETYIPVHSTEPGYPVVAAVELYKTSDKILSTIHKSKQDIWIARFWASLVVYITLYLIVRRGAIIMDQQASRIGALRSIALVGEFSNAIAHSLRNPIAGIRYTAELCMVQKGEVALPMKKIVAAVDRVDEYIEQLLEYAKSDHNQVRAIDPIEPIKSVLRKKSESLEASQIVTELSDNRKRNRPICCEEVVLEHVITSIVTNSIEAMSVGGQLMICIYESGWSSVIVEFIDNGSGMTIDILEKIGRGNFTTKSRGFGLGLGMARNAIERWGGRFELESQLGSGTKVRLIFRGAA